MTKKTISGITNAAGAAATGGGKGKAPPPKKLSLEEAIKSLKTYDWGVDRRTLASIDEAIIAEHGNAANRKKLEMALVGALAGGVSRSAQDYICRRLRVIGTAASVKALAALLAKPDTSHIARFALERMECPAAGAAILAALPKADAKTRPGFIGSLGVRREKAATAAIAKFLGDSDPLTVKAACKALALIGTPEAAKALAAFVKKAPAAVKIPAADACLICAEQLLADGKKTDATGLYSMLKAGDQPKHVKVAATKGMLTAATKK
jgi:hypothetical protein